MSRDGDKWKIRKYLLNADQKTLMRISTSSAENCRFIVAVSTCIPKSMIILKAIPAYSHEILFSSHHAKIAVDIRSNAWIVVILLAP